MNTKSIFKLILYVGVASIILSLVPIIVYWQNFKDTPLSSSSSDWGVFADYVGGTSGTILTFLAVLFSLTSIYFTARISDQIQKEEFNFLKKQSEQQLNTLHQQNKPYPFLDLVKYEAITEIIIQNMGLGPLIITRWEVLYEQKCYSNFVELLIDNFDADFNVIKIDYNSASEHVLAPNTEKKLLTIKSVGNPREQFYKLQATVRKILGSSEIYMVYEDIFGNSFENRRKLEFFR